MKDAPQIQRLRRALPKVQGHSFGPDYRIKVHPRSRAAYCDCRVCGAAVIAPADQDRILGVATERPCDP